jgi:hypothetical protein
MQGRSACGCKISIQRRVAPYSASTQEIAARPGATRWSRTGGSPWARGRRVRGVGWCSSSRWHSSTSEVRRQSAGRRQGRGWALRQGWSRRRQADDAIVITAPAQEKGGGVRTGRVREKKGRKRDQQRGETRRGDGSDAHGDASID